MRLSEASKVVSATGTPSRETRTAACPLVSIPETERVFQNLSAVLKAASKSFDDVVRAGVFLTNMTDFAAMNGIYAKYFSQPFPARTTIAAVALPLGACVEIDLVVMALGPTTRVISLRTDFQSLVFSALHRSAVIN